jgi:medium-chain acyl-[acyl-carrier-protein] hydrolase
MDALLSDIGPALQQHRDRPIALFGHSMDALVIYELTRWLRQFGLEAPRHLIVAGFPAPQHPNIERGRVLHTLPGPELIATLRQLNGIPKQLLDEPALLDQALPNFRSDIELVERYAHVEQAPLSVPLLTLGGLDDIVGVVRLRGWEACSDGAFALRMFKGGTSFLNPI